MTTTHSVGPRSRPKRAKMFTAAAAVLTLATGGAIYSATSADHTTADSSASPPTPTEASALHADGALCGADLPEAVKVFPQEAGEDVVETQTVDDDGRLVYKASFEDTTITVSWPAIDRLREREPAPSWPQGYGVSVGGMAAVGEQPDDLSLLSGMPEAVLADDANSGSYGGLVDVDATDAIFEGVCGTISVSAGYQGEQGQTFAYDFNTPNGGDQLSVQPLVRTSEDSETPPVLDKTPNGACPGGFTPLDVTAEESGEDTWVREGVTTPVSSSLEALEDALTATGFRDKDNFTEIQVSEALVVYALGENDPQTGEPVDDADYYMAFHIEKQADGWLATQLETATGC